MGMKDIVREYVQKKVAPGYERYADGTVGASTRMMIRGGCLPVRTNDNDTNDRCICGEPETERHVLLDCTRSNREHMKWSNKWDQEMGNATKMDGMKGYQESVIIWKNVLWHIWRF